MVAEFTNEIDHTHTRHTGDEKHGTRAELSVRMCVRCASSSSSLVFHARPSRTRGGLGAWVPALHGSVRAWHGVHCAGKAAHRCSASRLGASRGLARLTPTLESATRLWGARGSVTMALACSVSPDAGGDGLDALARKHGRLEA